MSKIKNGGLDQYGTGPFEQQQFGTAGVEGVKQFESYRNWKKLVQLSPKLNGVVTFCGPECIGSVPLSTGYDRLTVLQCGQLRRHSDVRGQQLQQRQSTHRVRLVSAGRRVSSAGRHHGLLLHIRYQGSLAQHQESGDSHRSRQVRQRT